MLYNITIIIDCTSVVKGRCRYFLQTNTLYTVNPLPKTVSVCGLRIFAESRRESEKALARLIEIHVGRAALVFTPNLEMLSAAKNDSRISSLLRRADLLLPDGVGTRILSGFRIKERLPGIEAGEFLLSLAARRGYRIYLLGGKSGVPERAACALKHRYPGLRIVGTHHGYFSPCSREENAVTARIRAAAPDVLIVCMGFPRQESYLLRVRDALPSLRIGIALGGAVDVWSGTVCRAPAVFRACACEWLWRVAREPRRAGRLLKSVLRLL